MQKQPIFTNDTDRIRLLFLILTFQGELKIKRISRILKESGQHSMLTIDQRLSKEIVEGRMVELIVFTFMPNHFHLVLREIKEDGIAKYMQRIENAYTKYYNARYQKSGHLFQGSYKSVHIENDEQLMHVSAYSHKNPTELIEWKSKLEMYQWSSYPDYLNYNRWGALLVTDSILKRFKLSSEYKKFVDSSLAKE